MSARKVVDARTLMESPPAAESFDGADPQAARKRAASMVDVIMELIIFFI
jgi:hypothetical protein